MAEPLHVAAFGDIEIDVDAAQPSQAFMTVPIVLRDGTAFSLRLDTEQMRELWIVMSGVARARPAALGIQ